MIEFASLSVGNDLDDALLRLNSPIADDSERVREGTIRGASAARINSLASPMQHAVRQI